MKLKNKKAVEVWLENFDKYASYDADRGKHYFVFDDVARGGQYTLMRYENGFFTIHSRGEDYCDSDETLLIYDEVIALVWKNRKHIHKEMRRRY
jgi:hypothetical protein